MGGRGWGQVQAPGLNQRCQAHSFSEVGSRSPRIWRLHRRSRRPGDPVPRAGGGGRASGRFLRGWRRGRLRAAGAEPAATGGLGYASPGPRTAPVGGSRAPPGSRRSSGGAARLSPQDRRAALRVVQCFTMDLRMLSRELSLYLEHQVRVGFFGSGVGLSLILGFSVAYACYYLSSIAKVSRRTGWREARAPAAAQGRE